MNTYLVLLPFLDTLYFAYFPKSEYFCIMNDNEKSPYTFIPVRSGIIYEELQITMKHGSSGTYSLPVPRYIDVEVGAKVFKTKENLALINSLSNNTLRLFNYIVFHLGANKEDIQLPRLKVIEEINVSKNTYYKCLTELCDKSIITSKPGNNMYWVNIHIIFNGNRAKYMKEKYGDDSLDILFKGNKGE